MTDARRFVRRNRVDERVAVGIAIVSGTVAATAGAQPTGSAVVDVALVFLSVSAVVWASASAPWWALASACGIGAAIALQPVVAAIGFIGFIGGLVVGARRQDQPELRAVVGGIAANVLIRSELQGFFGLSALVGICVLGALFVVGLHRRPSTIRRYGWITLGAVMGLVVVAMLGLSVAVISARPDLTNASRQSQAAIDSLNAGDYELAAQTLQQASSSFARADNRLGGLLTLPSRLIPIFAQNVVAGADLAEVAQGATAEAASALGEVDADALRVADGVIDVEAISAVEAPLLRVQGALEDLNVAANEVQSPWLLDRVQQELSDLEADLDDNEPRLQNAIDAVRLAPQLLGADGQRRYLIMFNSPAEARGITGFIGNYADVTIDDGKIEVAEFGRRSDLEDYVAENGAKCIGCPEEFVNRYGRYSLAAIPDLAVGPRGWSNLTIPAYFPYVAEVASILYPQSGGAPIDGVIAMDPYVLQTLMSYTGPLDVPELGVTVRPRNAAQFILEDQYVLADDAGNDERIEGIDTFGQQVIQALLAGSLPVPSKLANDLGPLIDEQRLLVWTNDPDERELFDRIGLLGALPELGDDGGFGVTVTNGGLSKIDVFLHRETEVRIETAADGQRVLIAEVTFRNDAPAFGLPRNVIGNAYGLPEGTNRMLVSFYGPSGLRGVLRDGEPVEVDTFPEAGWMAHSRTDNLAPGDSVTYRVEFELGPPSDGIDEPVLWEQPLADRAS
jgi:hypothetical protein